MGYDEERFEVGQVVYYNDTRVTVVEGPTRTLEYPDHDQYWCHAPGPYGGHRKTIWASDLMTEDEYAEATRGE